MFTMTEKKKKSNYQYHMFVIFNCDVMRMCKYTRIMFFFFF